MADVGRVTVEFEAMIGLGERLLGRRDEIDGIQTGIRTCSGCGAALADGDVTDDWHVRSEHDADCDGTEERCFERCPVAIQCGPVLA